MTRARRFDVIVVGGGPAGLSAAMVLARACRSVLVVDHGRPRNAAASAIHGFLSRDGTAPLDLLTIGRREARRYGARLRRGKVIGIFRHGAMLGARLASGERFFARRMLIATGVEDRIPALAGLGPLYG